MKIIEFQEIYLDHDSKYRNTINKVYISVDKIISIAPIDIKGFPKKVYGVKLLDGLTYKGSCAYFDEKIGES